MVGLLELTVPCSIKSPNERTIDHVRYDILWYKYEQILQYFEGNIQFDITMLLIYFHLYLKQSKNQIIVG